MRLGGPGRCGDAARVRELGRRHRARAAVRRPLAPAGPAVGAAGARHRHGRGGRPGRVRGGARPLVAAARPRQGAGLPAAGGGQPLPLGAAAPRPSSTRHAAREAGSRPPRAGADEAALAADRRDAVLDAMRALPDRQREVLALRYYLDLSEAEIADTLGHQPRRREEPRLARVRRAADPARATTWRTGHDPPRRPAPRRPPRRAPVSTPCPDVEPRPRPRRASATERKRRTTMSSRRPWLYAVGGAVVATAAVITAIAVAGGGLPGADDDPAPAGRRPPPAAERRDPDRGAVVPAPSASEPPDSAGGVVGVYFAGDTPAGPRLYREFLPNTDGTEPIAFAVDTSLSGARRGPRLRQPVAVRGLRDRGGVRRRRDHRPAQRGTGRPAVGDDQGRGEAGVAASRLQRPGRARRRARAGPGREPRRPATRSWASRRPSRWNAASALKTSSHVSLTSPAEGQTVSGTRSRSKAWPTRSRPMSRRAGVERQLGVRWRRRTAVHRRGLDGRQAVPVLRRRSTSPTCRRASTCSRRPPTTRQGARRGSARSPTPGTSPSSSRRSALGWSACA